MLQAGDEISSTMVAIEERMKMRVEIKIIKLITTLAANRQLTRSTRAAYPSKNQARRLWMVLCRLARVRLGRLLPQDETKNTPGFRDFNYSPL